MPPSPAQSNGCFSPAERRSLTAYAAAIAALHVLGWGLCLADSGSHPALLGLGLSAYLFGLRHAFDADHIAAVDDTVRYMVQQGRAPMGVGFFFSLGHSTVVFLLALATILVAALVQREMPGLEHAGHLIGTLVSGLFLWVIGLLNLGVLLDMLQIWKRRHNAHSHASLDAIMARRGLLYRVFGARLTRMLDRSWKLYPLGFLFGLGFDTASEIALLALTAGAAVSHIPAGTVLALPLLFAAGMSLMDTANGVLMTRAYGWAFFNPVRRIFYNLTTTSLAVAVALVIGSVELAQVLIGRLGLHGSVANTLAAMSFDTLGYVVVAMFLLAWAVSYTVWRLGAFERAHIEP